MNEAKIQIYDDFYYDDENNHKISINLYRLFPEAAKRVRMLEDLKKSLKEVLSYAYSAL